MITRDQERAALKQITAIMDAIGEESYISIALEGCLEDAEGNIANDTACSMKSRWKCAEQKASKLEGELLKARVEKLGLIAKIDSVRKTAVDLVDGYNDVQTDLQDALDCAGQELIEMIGTVSTCDIKFIRAMEQIESLKDKLACFGCIESQVGLLDTAQQAARG